MIVLTEQPPHVERLVTKEDLDALKAANKEALDALKADFNEHCDKIERDLAQIKFGCAVVLALLVKIAFF